MNDDAGAARFDGGWETALAVLGYEWTIRGGASQVGDVISAVEALRRAAADVPQDPVPLSVLYPAVARLAALSLGLLARIGDPDEVDGLRGYEGFALWRESRPS
jgi:hypothetical protein